jgi:tRNA (guanine37-N1)-methyltransferase
VQIEVVTLFPEMIRDALRFGIVGRAIERGLVEVGTEDPRAHTTDAHRTVDDRPYGGGPGMVLKPEPVLAATRAAHARLPHGSPRIYLSAQGEMFDQRRAEELAALPGLLLLAGRYEGLDERIVTLGVDRELSVGDYVLSGGELPALLVIDAVTRLLPGALGDERSSAEESFAHGGLLDWPHYTRPEVFEGLSVPAVLKSGNHADVRRWREQQSAVRTFLRRPDLIVKHGLAAGPSRLLNEFLAARKGGESAIEGDSHEQDSSGNREEPHDPQDPGVQAR